MNPNPKKLDIKELEAKVKESVEELNGYLEGFKKLPSDIAQLSKDLTQPSLAITDELSAIAQLSKDHPEVSQVLEKYSSALKSVQSAITKLPSTLTGDILTHIETFILFIKSSSSIINSSL